MSINSPNLNIQMKKPGLNGSFGSKSLNVDTKTTGVASKAAANLANPSPASKTSIFKFTPSGTYTRVAGQNTLNRSNQVSASQRAMANNGRGGIRREAGTAGVPVGYFGIGAQQGHQHMSGLAKGLTYAGIAAQTFAMGAMMFGGGGSQVSGGQALSAGMASLGPEPNLSSAAPGGGVAGGAIRNMASCEDSGSLSSAINDAENAKANLTSGLDAYTHLASQALSSSENGIAALDQKIGTAEGQYRAADNLCTQAKQSVDAAGQGRTRALAQFQGLDKSYTSAVDAYVTAHDKAVDAQMVKMGTSKSYEIAKTNTANAKQTLESTDKEIEVSDGNGGTKKVPNPAYAKAEAALKEAEAAEQRAKAEDEKAGEAVTQANDAETQATANKDKAREALTEGKEQAKKAEEALTQANKTFDAQKKNFVVQQNKCLDLKNTLNHLTDKREEQQSYIDTAKERQMEMSVLDQAITQNKQRLEKLQKAEEKELKSLGKKISKGETKMTKYSEKFDLNDGDISKKDAKYSAKYEQKSAEVGAYKARQAYLKALHPGS